MQSIKIQCIIIVQKTSHFVVHTKYGKDCHNEKQEHQHIEDRLQTLKNLLQNSKMNGRDACSRTNNQICTQVKSVSELHINLMKPIS